VNQVLTIRRFNLRHLTNVENRLQKLEALFARLLPDVDIEDALSSMTPRSPYQSPRGNQFEDALSPDQSSEQPAAVKRVKTLDRSPTGIPVEALPEEADGFDWKEEATDVSDLADGMAALSVEPAGIGYLGKHPVKSSCNIY
jgi:transcriptional regulatory protein GAL4